MPLLKQKHSLFFITILLLSALAGKISFAETVKGCHCFRNRTFDPAEKFAADNYTLATSFNSLISRSFGISKGQIVMLKMKGGVNPNDLLVGLKTARVSGIDLQHVIALRQSNQSWQKILTSPGVSDSVKNDTILTAVQSGISTDEAGQKIAHEMIAAFYGVPIERVENLRLVGLTAKEINLVFILSHISGKKAEAFVELYKKEGKSWSEIANSLAIEPASTGKLILNYPEKQTAHN